MSKSTVSNEKTFTEILIEYSKRFGLPFPILYMNGTPTEVIIERIKTCLDNDEIYDLGKHRVRIQNVKRGVDYKNVINKIMESMNSIQYDYKSLLLEQLEPIYERKRGKEFTFEEHLEGLIKSLLNNHRWGDNTVKENYEDIKIIFNNFDKEYLKEVDPELLYNRLLAIECGNVMLRKQLEGLKKNIKTMEKIEKDYGSLDAFVLSESPNTLANILYTGKYQLEQVGISFALEYLRKVGIDTCKVDSQVKRLFGSDRLGLVKNKTATSLQSMKLIKEIARDSNLTEIEVDSILWQFCIQRGAYICSEVPRCNYCKLKDVCNYNK